MGYMKAPVNIIFVLVMALSLLTSAGFSATSNADSECPTESITVTLPPDVNEPLMFGHANYDMADIGYMQSEFFIEGCANYYTTSDPLTEDGLWNVEIANQPAPYKIRIVVNRPIDEEDFNGTVLVEWFNVSGSADGSPFWLQAHVELARRGWIYVGVSAQWAGVNTLKGLPPLGGMYGDPVRYGSLNHPGDSYSYDIFSQAGQAILDNAEVVLGGLEPEILIAGGESQSAGRLVTYINAAHPDMEVYDGFCVYSRGAGGSALSQSSMGMLMQPPMIVPYPDDWPYPLPPDVPTPEPAYIRENLNAPVLVFQAEGDVRGLKARQPDTPMFRLWEVAGEAHFDTYGLVTSRNDIGKRESVAEWFDYMLNPTACPREGFCCSSEINNGPATFVLRAGLNHLNRWIKCGTPPPVAPRLQTIDYDPPYTPPTGEPYYYRDANGNVIGGIRTPAVDAAVATLSGLGQSGSMASFCGAFGTTIPFTEEQLKDQYRNHGRFVSAWVHATWDAYREGFILREDRRDLCVVAAQSCVLSWRPSCSGN